MMQFHSPKFLDSNRGSTVEYSQAFPEAINQRLEERFIVRDCLENVPISSDIPNSPLTQTGTAQPENVTENREKQNLDYIGLH